MVDEEMWRMGIYIHSAVGTAIDNWWNGKKSKAKYIEKPLLQSIEENNGKMSEDELKKQRELFVAKLLVMQSNFEINHPKKQK